MSDQQSYLEEAFLRAVNVVQNEYSDEEIQIKWNAAGLGKPAEVTTIQRWLRLGPETKNPRFEPWIVGLASQTSSNPNTELARYLLQTHYRDNVVTMTTEYNELFNDSLSQSAVERYTNSGSGYEKGPPTQFVRFIRFIQKTKLK